MNNRSVLPHTLVIYQPDFEKEEDDEAETQTKLLETLQKISEITYEDSGHATRSVHAKTQGLVRGEMTVLPGLPYELRQGIFSTETTYPMVMRFSTIPGDILDDNVSVPRGLAIKVIGVEGERLPDSESATTQDFLFVNGPNFLAPTAKKFLHSLKLLASTTDKAPGLKRAISTAFRTLEKVIEAAGSESGTIKSLGGHPKTHILGETFYTQVPILFGSYIAKFSVAPIAPELVLLKDKEVDLDDKSNGLRDAVIDFFSSNQAVWEVRVQLCTDLETMPIEDASVAWPESQSPYIAVARIVAAPQAAWNSALEEAVDERMSFSPWHGITAHRPLGSIMRVRKAAYELSSRFRTEHNHKNIKEPDNLDDFPTT